MAITIQISDDVREVVKDYLDFRRELVEAEEQGGASASGWQELDDTGHMLAEVLADALGFDEVK